ncbi:hypothetical protein HK099_003446 [Clydaea vesicula]|uniref:Uncharacterized protein n=1 Tax=Clydaea vesicula TaxID=447962 RepID=A0AAD5U3J0_9FUNG|nr:hypothetical protein HK099_003446 [Clydaea vesicula]
MTSPLPKKLIIAVIGCFFLFTVIRISQNSNKEDMQSAANDELDDLNSLNYISEKDIFDKMFSNVLKPTKLEPYYFKCNCEPKADDITIATLMTVDRLSNLFNSLSSNEAFYSVAVHITDNEELEKNLSKLKYFLLENKKLFANRVDLHLITDKYPRQLNYFRNVARFFSRTDLILPLDVDFMLNEKFLSNIKSDDFVMEKLTSGNGIFILPAFEYREQWKKTTFEEFPQKKSEVVENFEKTLKIFHGKRNLGHKSTDYEKWLNATQVYQIQPESFRYEPFGIFNTTTVPWSDERFIGYGGNKATWWYEIYLAGLEFYVLPYNFVIHIHHSYAVGKVRDDEREQNSDAILNFINEICKRYRIMFENSGGGIYDMMGCHPVLIDEEVSAPTIDPPPVAQAIPAQ